MKAMKLILISLGAGATVVASGVAFPESAYFVLWPGLAISAPIWPQGAHSDFSGPAGIVAMLTVVWLGAWLAWSTIAGLILRLATRVAA
jgi:hypothetical protein